MSSPKHARKRRAGSSKLANDPGDHLAELFIPQTPIGSNTLGTEASSAPKGDLRRRAFNWAVNPVTSLKMLMVPLILWASWEVLVPYISTNLPNPLEPLIFLSNRVSDSTDDDPRYAKSYLDLFFIAYYVVFWSLIRQIVVVHISRRIARAFRLKKRAKLLRLGEQTYAVLYFSTMGAWGYRIMTQLPTYWYRTEAFWIGYPHWDMKPELKRYYLMQMAYWLQQLIVLVMRLEKPRKDHNELVAHHIVTLWLVGWSYLINLTLIGNAVYMSMDIPDVFLALSLALDYLQRERAKIVSFVVLIGTWTYFRHYLNIVILHSVWTQFDLIDIKNRVWNPPSGAWLVWWMKYQIFVPILLLQFLNLFWYYLIWRIAYRALTEEQLTDIRSDDEDDAKDE